MNYNINIKDNNIVCHLLTGAGEVAAKAAKRLDRAKDENSSVAYYAMKFKEAEAIYASLDYLWHKNHHASLKSYGGDDPVSKAELAVRKAEVSREKAKLDLAVLEAEKAEKAWLAA